MLSLSLLISPEMEAGTLHFERHDDIIRNLLRPPPQTPESCRSAASAASTTPSSVPPALSDTSAARPPLPQPINHFVSHFSYDDLIIKLTQLIRTASLVDRRLLALSATAAEELEACKARVRLVDCSGAEHVEIVQVYEPFHLLHRRLLKLLPAPLHGWLRLGLLPAPADDSEDKQNVGAAPGSIQPLPTHCVHASIRQLLQHACHDHLTSPSPPLTLHLGCYADVEVWAANTLTSPPTYFRLQNVRVVGDHTVREQFSPAITQQLRARLALTGQPDWRWYRALRVIGVSGQPLDMDKAVELTGAMRVLSCQLDQIDAVLVASITYLPPSSSTTSAPANEVQLLVQRLAGDHITLSFDANETVASLKRCLHTSFHVPLDEQELFFQQEALDDDSLIGSYLQVDSDNRIALLLSSPSPVLVSSVVYQPITYYSHRAIHDVRELMLMRVPARREVRGWAVAQCVEWLEVSRGRLGRVWAAVEGRAVKGVSSTGLSWLPDAEEEALWQQTRDSHLRQLDSVDVSYDPTTDTVPSSVHRAVSATVAKWPHECVAEEDGVPRVEHIDLDDDGSVYDESHARLLPRFKRSLSAPVISPNKVSKRQRRQRRRQVAAVVDLRETVVDSAGEEEDAVCGQSSEDEDVVEVQVVTRSAHCSASTPSAGSRAGVAHRQLSFAVLD